jgi:hypothetical protein
LVTADGDNMDEQPDIVSSGSEWRPSDERRFTDEWRLSDRRRGSSPTEPSPTEPSPGWSSPAAPGLSGPGRPRPGRLRPGRPRPGRRGWIAIFLAGALLTSLGVSLGLTRLGTPHEPAASTASRAARTAASPAVVARPAISATIVARPAISGTAVYALPGATKNAFSVVVLAVRPSPDSAPRTWLFVYGRDIHPGQRYGLLEDTCGGQYVTASDVADGTADQRGYLTIVARNLDISPTASDVWILLYRQEDGVSMGGVQGPLTGQGARTFRSVPRC